MAKIIHPMADLPPDDAPLDPEAQEDVDVAIEPAGDDDENEYEEQEDGSVIVRAPKAEEERESEHDENMAEWLDESKLSELGREFCELIESDKEARNERDKQYALGIKRTGMGGEKGVGADFDGASSVTHPMLAKGCVDFGSKAIKELFPSSGPVRTQIIGNQTDLKIERAERKKTYMNWQLTEQVPEHRPEFEKMLSQLPLGGSQYKRWWHDAKLKRNRTAAVYIDDIFLPYDQNDFYTTPRLTHREFIGPAEFQARVDSELYIDVDLNSPGGDPDRSESDKAARKVEGVSDDAAIYTNNGGTREMYTVYADLDMDDDGDIKPYILHISEYGNKVVGVYRNWDEKDEMCKRLHWIVEYTFIPWRGAYGVGLAHLIGSMSVASTGALNALLDAAHINNFPGGLKLKGGRTAGQTVSVNATELKEIDAPPGVDDIRKLVMAFPFNGPSTVLYTLLEWLTQQAEMVISTASEKIADAGANMPMGTALALIEGGSTNFSAIHARLHHSARKELEIVHRLNATYLDDEQVVEELGELVVYRSDFQGPMDILPVSDPNIFSEAQRYAQLQAVMQLETVPEFKPFFKPEKLLVRALKLLQVPYAEDIAHLPKDPQRLQPSDENAAASDKEGAPLKVYQDQDDLAHMQSHVMFMTSPLLGANPLIGGIALPKLLDHCREHLIAYYAKHHKAATQALLVIARGQGQQIGMEQAQQQGHAFADKALAAQLAPVVAPGLEAAQKLAQQFAPKPPADGNTQANLAAQQQMKQAELKAAADEAEKKRQWEAGQKDLDRKEETARHSATVAAQQDATRLATLIEKMQDDTEKQIAALALKSEQSRDEAAQANARWLADQKAQSAEQLEVLKAMLADQAETTAAQPDVGATVQPMIQSSHDQLSKYMQDQHSAIMDMMKQVVTGLQALHAAHAAPRTARYIKDEQGNNIGVESSINGQTHTTPLQ